MKRTLVLGASEKPERYSNMAIQRLAALGHPVVAVGARKGQIGNTPIVSEFPIDAQRIDTVTLYLNQKAQETYYDDILNLKPHRLIFNPGTENPELETLASQQGIETINACTLVMLGTGGY